MWWNVYYGRQIGCEELYLPIDLSQKKFARTIIRNLGIDFNTKLKSYSHLETSYCKALQISYNYIRSYTKYKLIAPVIYTRIQTALL